MFKQTITLALAAFAAACSTTTARPAATTSASICQGGTVHSDAELERYSSCEHIAGDLVVEGVSTLESLARLRQVDGALRIQGTARLYSLSGLDNLTNLSELSLQRNRALINASSLNGVLQVFRVTITGNPRLTQAYGLLKGLRVEPSRVTISANAGLDAEGLRIPSGGVLLAAARDLDR